jgi:hypothetical protein
LSKKHIGCSKKRNWRGYFAKATLVAAAVAFSVGGLRLRRQPRKKRAKRPPANWCDALQKVRFWDPEHWRFRAEATRTVADQMTHEEARAIMRRIANDYDRLAKLAEEQLRQSGKKSNWR